MFGWIDKLTLASMARGTTVALLAYSLVVFIAYVTLIAVFSYHGIYWGNFSLPFNLVMCVLFYGTLGIHLSPGIEWFGKNRSERHHNRIMSQTFALIGALLTAFLGSAYLYFDLLKNNWNAIKI